MTKPVIGFIGLGLMGGNMVENLQKRGYDLVVMDLNKDAVQAVLDRGNAKEASSPKELAEASDIVMLCLTTSEVVEKVVYGDNGILAGIKEGATLIDFGTSIPASTRKIGADLAAKGAGMIDAPLGRTPAHAKDGLLNIMAAGDKARRTGRKRLLPRCAGRGAYHQIDQQLHGHDHRLHHVPGLCRGRSRRCGSRAVV